MVWGVIFRRGNGRWEETKWSAWQIAGQPNEFHHYFGSCNNFLRPDGTICYPRDLIQAGSSSFQTARIKNAMMTWWYVLQPVRTTLLILKVYTGNTAESLHDIEQILLELPQGDFSLCFSLFSVCTVVLPLSMHNFSLVWTDVQVTLIRQVHENLI